jgi:signal peptide peptidase SppA
MDTTETPQCWSNHLGIWVIEPLWFMQAVSLYKAGLYEVPRSEWISLTSYGKVFVHAADTPRGRETRPYDVVDGVAVIPLHGPMSKAGSPKFQEASTVQTRQIIRMAGRDEAVAKLMLHVYSPGGHVDGTHELAADVSRAGLTKPVYAHIEDLGASAAYWVASQASRITANATAEVGSIGTVAVLEDTSKRMDRLGIEVHVLSTGPYKGAGVDGAPLSAEALAYFRGRVESLNAHFLAAIRRGRGLSEAQVDAVSDGRVHIASMAQSYGLIDAVQSFDEALEAAQRGEPPPIPAATPPGRHFGHQRAIQGQRLQLARGRP